MNMKTAVALLVLLILLGGRIADCRGPRASEQVDFSAEDTSVKKPVPMPKAVWDILKADGPVPDTLEREHISPHTIPASWFLVSAIHLSSAQKPDYIVMGEGPLRGANVIPFWVFCATDSGYALVLTAPAFGLTVKSTRWKGHRNIELDSATAVQISTVLLRFDGERYVEYQSKSEPIK
jgi:hypothetical protein